MKVTVHIGFEQDDLKKLDAWGKSRRLTRGAAIMTLLDLAEGREPSLDQTPTRILEKDEDPYS